MDPVIIVRFLIGRGYSEYGPYVIVGQDNEDVIIMYAEQELIIICR